MSKVRLRPEEVLFTRRIDVINIPKKFHFDFNHKWITSNSDTKRIAVEKNLSNESNC
jgi:hypothetical protein